MLLYQMIESGTGAAAYADMLQAVLTLAVMAPGGPGTLAEADAWYFILDATRGPSVAEAQAMAITELTAHAVGDLNGEPRAMLLAADDYSAVSRRVRSRTCTSGAGPSA